MTFAFPDRGPRRPAGRLSLPADRPQRPGAGPEPDSARDPAATAAAPPCHDARRLTGAQGLATILLDGQSYQLRITRAGRLILTK